MLEKWWLGKMDNEIIENVEEDESIILSANADLLHNANGEVVTVEDAKSSLPENYQLIKLAMQGDKKAFNELFMQSYRYVLFIVHQYISDDETAYDVIQEVFIKVYKNISLLREPSAFYGWLTVITKNTSKDFLRTFAIKKEMVEYEFEDTSVFLKDQTPNSDVAMDIKEVLNRLDPNDAELLSRVYYDGMRVAEIAKMQGVPASTVYSRFKSAKKHLKEVLKERGIDKAIYSGNIASMITIGFRNLIGTALLSLVIAQQILDSVVKGKGRKELAIAKIIRQQRNKALLKIASIIVVICIVTSSVTFLFLNGFGKNHAGGDKNSTQTSSSWFNIFEKNDDKTEDKGTTDSEKKNSFLDWVKSFEFDKSNSKSKPDEELETEGEEFIYEYIDSSGGEIDFSAGSDKKENGSSSSPSSSSSASSSSNAGGSSSGSESENETVPPEHISSEKFGNTYNNVHWGSGMVAKSNGWLYYCAEENYVYILYKLKEDGSGEKTKLASDLCPDPYINVVGDWIYYLSGRSSGIGHIKKMKTDGTQKQQVSDIQADKLLVIDKTAYCVSEVTDSFKGVTTISYYKINLETGESEVILDNLNTTSVCMTNKYMIAAFYNYNSPEDCIKIYDNQTGEVVKKLDWGHFFFLNDQLIVRNDNLYSYDLNNLDATPQLLASGTRYNEVLFVSKYKGGCIGGNLTGDADILYLSDLSSHGWQFEWGRSLAYGKRFYASFDDGYVYYVYEDTLHRSYPDGTGYLAY